jgi:hypothetical protein
MEDLKIYLNPSTIKNINRFLSRRKFGMSTGLSTIWLLIWSNQKEDSSGHAKIMMGMFRVIQWLKVNIV